MSDTTARPGDVTLAAIMLAAVLRCCLAAYVRDGKLTGDHTGSPSGTAVTRLRMGG